MIGILCEKSSAAKNFSKALGAKAGKFNNETHMLGNYNGEDFVIVHARGHLYSYGDDPSKQVDPSLSPKYKSWDLANLPWNEQDFKWDLHKNKDVDGLLKTIKSALSKCDEIVIATDVDASGEGQLLAWEVLDQLHFKPKKWSRMHFDDEGVGPIQKAFKSRTQLPGMLADPEYQKALYRSQWDFLSMQFTRVATKCGDGRSVLRQGRLKSAMVSITGDGLAAVANYKKVPSYSNRFKDENGVVYSSKDEPEFPKKDQVPNKYSTSRVIIDSKTLKRTAPPKLLDLAGLASILSSKGIKAKDVLATYQKMYEQQIVSYPRTEDKCVTPDQFNDLLPLIDKIAGVVGINPNALTHRAPRKTHVMTGGAHGANRPGSNVPSNLDNLKAFGACGPMIYEILAKNYLSILAEDYEYEAQKGHLETYPSFIGTCSVPVKMGYKNIFSDDDDAGSLDTNNKGLGTQASPFIHEGFPPKPQAPSMSWLMKILEKRNVGTGATRTSIYGEVTNDKAKYPLLIEKKGKLSMSPYGEMSYILLKGTNIGDLAITEQLLADMKAIEQGKANPATCLHNMQQLVSHDLQIMKRNGAQMRKDTGVTMSEQKEKCEGMWNGQSVSFNRVWGGHRFTDEECEALCDGKEIEIFDMISKAGKPYGITGKLTNQVYEKRKFVGFERTGFANKPGVPDSWCGHNFTADEKLLLEAGKSIKITGCKSKKGNIFDCNVTYGQQDSGSMGIIPNFG